MKNALVAAAIAFMTGGCSPLVTRLASTPVGNPDAGSLQAGLIYRLPAKQFVVAATFETRGCTYEAGAVRLLGNVQVNVTEEIVADPSHTYVLDYQQLAGLTKVSNADITVSESGMLKGINSSIKDETGAVLKDSVSAIFNATRAALFPVSISSMQLGVDPGKDPCERYDEAKKALDEAQAALNGARDNETKALQLQQTLLRARSLKKQLEADAEFQDKYGTEEIKEGILSRLAGLEEFIRETESELQSMSADASDLERAERMLASARDKLVFSTAKVLAPKSRGASETLRFPEASLNALFAGTALETAPLCSTEVKLRCFDVPQVVVSVEGLFNDGGQTPATEGEQAEASRRLAGSELGIVYRVPESARLRVKAQSAQGREVELLNRISEIPQFGPIGSLNLRNLVFDDNSLNVDFNGNGGVGKLTFHSEAQAKEAAASASSITSTYLDFVKNLRGDRLTAKKEQIELDTSGAELDKALAATAADVASSEVKALKEIQRLEAIRNGSATAAELELEALEAQRDILAKQLEILKIQNEIAKEKAKAAGNAE